MNKNEYIGSAEPSPVFVPDSRCLGPFDRRRQNRALPDCSTVSLFDYSWRCCCSKSC